MSDDADMERVRKEIEQIKRELGEQTPPNEATTCSWVVEPLLLVAGYRRMDWIQEVAGLQGNKYRPDYTVLAETPHCWLLEAKTWNHPLLEQDANQLTSYANVHNIRWAVLTNGKEWQLYDASIFRTVSQRLMAQADLDHPEALAEFLLALSPQSVKQGVIERFARRSRMEKEMETQFAEANSPIVQAISEKIREATGIDYDPHEVVEYLLSLLSTRGGGVVGPYVEETLAVLRRHVRDLPFSEPCALVFPDGTEILGKHWRRILLRALEKWAEQYTIPVPFPLEGSHSYYLTNHEPFHPNGKRFENTHEMRLPSQTFCVNIFLDANRIVRELHHLVTHFGEDPERYIVRYYPAERRSKP